MKNILIIDSGSGGVNILVSCLKQKIEGNYFLFIDQKNLPYGEKSEEELKEIAQNIIEDFKFFHPEIIVLGCNTLTSVAIEFLRQKYDGITFVGSEPAIKPALLEFEKKDVLVLATNSTIKNSKILKNYKDICFVPQKLPQIIDENLFERKNISNYLKNILKNKHPKAVVLGCTHFEEIKDELKNVLCCSKFFSSGEGIAKRLKTFCECGNSFQVQIMCSQEEKQGLFLEYFNHLMSKGNWLNQSLFQVCCNKYIL